ncbi:hypothetical protein [Modestobacter italicus]|uniref:hypothetical protein n=1 Tax=Modestobacter italicus (strain DSM 44449 / CECT 9708 / BC 501) TaxID=2732864 RepID=UPI001C958F18|nr:hypothetical protein [Modestobacter italicus]
MADSPVQRWDLTAHGRQHRVEVTGSFTRTITWHVDEVLVAAKKSTDDTVRLTPGDRLDRSSRAGAVADRDGRPDVGAVAVTFTALGRPKRATWYQAEGRASAGTRAALGTGGIDLEPEPGSPAARREERIERHPRRHTALAVVGGVAKVVLPLLLGLLAVRLAVSLPWPDWDLPSIPWPDWDLPSVPWPDVDLPDVDLPDWQLPGWLTWLLDKAGYVWPVALAWVVAHREVRRRRQQQALREAAREAARATTGDVGEDGGADSEPADDLPPADAADRPEHHRTPPAREDGPGV